MAYSKAWIDTNDGRMSEIITVCKTKVKKGQISHPYNQEHSITRPYNIKASIQNKHNHVISPAQPIQFS